MVAILASAADMRDACTLVLLGWGTGLLAAVESVLLHWGCLFGVQSGAEEGMRTVACGFGLEVWTVALCKPYMGGSLDVVKHQK